MGRKAVSSAVWRSARNVLVRARRPILLLLLIASVLTICGSGLFLLHRHVRQRLAFPDSIPSVDLLHRPAWMSEELARQIADSVRPRAPRSALDDQLLRDVAELLQHNPWVQQVRQVRRVYARSPGDTIQIDCVFRAPLAMVQWRDQYILVDGQGCRLPVRFRGDSPPRVMFDSDGRPSLRIIQGVAAMPPYLDGQRWSGSDLQAGLDLAKLLYGKPFADQIHRIDVSNFRGRRNPRDPQIVLITDRGSEIRWGAPVRDGTNFEPAVIEKLSLLELLHGRFGRVDAMQPWVDLRYDRPRCPDRSPPLVRASQHESRVVDN